MFFEDIPPIDLMLSGVVPQHEFNWMRVKIILPCKILFAIFSDIIFYQSYRDYQRNKALAIIFDHFKKFLFLVRLQLLPEITRHVL